MIAAAELELDLEVFSGPFDLLLTLVLREDVDLLEVELADVVVSYLDHLDLRGELDLDVATEFLVLIAALLELKSRLMLRGEDDEGLEDFEPGEAAEELVARMIEARRYRRAAEHLAERLEAERGHRFRSAPPPPFLRRVVVQEQEAVYEPDRLGEAIGALLRKPAPLSLAHLTIPRVSVGERLAHLRALLRRGVVDFDEAVAGADRVTVAVTLFALLELYKQGEATWTQDAPFGPIEIASGARAPAAAARARRVSPLARTIEALLFLSSEPVSVADLAEAAQTSVADVEAALTELGAAYEPGSRGLLLRELAGGWTLVSAPDTEEAARRLLAKPRTPPLTPAQAETLAIVAYLQPVSRPEITRIRGVSADSAAGTLLERGLVEESGRSQFGAVLYRTTPLFLKLFGLAAIGDMPDPGQWDPAPGEEDELRERLLKAGDLRAGRRPSRSRPASIGAGRHDRRVRRPPAAVDDFVLAGDVAALAPSMRRTPSPRSARRSGRGSSRRLRRQLAARGVDVAPARQPHRRVVAALLEHRAERRDRLAR